MHTELCDAIDDKTELLRREQMKQVTERVLETFQERLGLAIVQTFDELPQAPWPAILACYKSAVDDATKQSSEQLAGFQLSAEQLVSVQSELLNHYADYFVRRVREELTDTLVLIRLRKKFERLFKYDAKGLPRLWQPGDDMDTPFKHSVETCLHLLTLLSKLDPTLLSDPVYFCPAKHAALSFISESRRTSLAQQFSREAESVFIDAKRSLTPTLTNIPPWLILLLVVLGWNEFMAILSSPLYLLLFVLACAVFYACHLASYFVPINALFSQGLVLLRARILAWLVGVTGQPLRPADRKEKVN
jgi:hypothetical protein